MASFPLVSATGKSRSGHQGARRSAATATVPIPTVGPPVGLMIVGEQSEDRHLLGVGRGIEAALNGAKRRRRSQLGF
jgi:hypothetical protein